jgi:hypothetical protein
MATPRAYFVTFTVLAMACGAATTGTSPRPSAAALAASSSAAPQAAPATFASGLSGSCVASEQEDALHEAEAEQRLVHVVFENGRVIEANEFRGSTAMGGTQSTFAGAGPIVQPDQWIELAMTTRRVVGAQPDPAASAGVGKLRFRVSGNVLNVEAGPSGQCEWSQRVGASASRAKSETAPPVSTAPTAPPKIESPEAGRVIVRVGMVTIDCSAQRSAHAALTECSLQGSASKATIAWGMSDEEDRLMCSRTPLAYSWEHGGGWDGSEDRFPKLDKAGARVRLAPSVEVWFARRIDEIELSVPGHAVRFDVDLDASRITSHPGAGRTHTDAKLLLDLSVAKQGENDCAGPW